LREVEPFMPSMPGGASPGEHAALDAAVDALAATLTVPTDTNGRRLRGGPIGDPAVDEQIWLIHVRYARSRRVDDRQQLVEHYENHARQLARRFYRNREPLDDLQQVALEGLLLALDRFEPERGMPFLGFANPTIIGCLKRFYRDSGWTVRVPRRVHELSRPLRDAWDALAQDFGRTPTPSELADLLGLETAVVEDALAAETMRTTGSLEGPTPDDGTSVEHALGAIDRDLERVENRAALQQSLSQRPDTEVELLQLYFEEGLTQSEIAERLGVRQMQVSRRLNRVLRRLRSHLP
jgi:RNA polymerase sigma-B factor